LRDDFESHLDEKLSGSGRHESVVNPAFTLLADAATIQFIGDTGGLGQGKKE
jgi:hypothetical protein